MSCVSGGAGERTYHHEFNFARRKAVSVNLRMTIGVFVLVRWRNVEMSE
jgi:hypothetical protein